MKPSKNKMFGYGASGSYDGSDANSEYETPS